MASLSGPKPGAHSHQSENGLHFRPLCKGLTVGAVIGILYCFAMRDLGFGLEMPRNMVDFYGPGPLNFTSIASSAATISFPPEEQGVKWLLALWEVSALLNFSRSPADALVVQAQHMLHNVTLPPPHLENCEERAAEYRKLDSRDSDGNRPAWSLWKGRIGWLPRDDPVDVDESEEMLGNRTALLWGPFPPWIEGAEEDNLPFTRRVQRDLWLLQHPRDCGDESVRFLVLDWETRSHLGLGAQINHVAGVFAFAVRERRVLVTQNFNRAEHGGCQGSDFMRWSCYFVPETTQECRHRAEQLISDQKALDDGLVLLGSRLKGPQYDAWLGLPPELWGTPWNHMQPTSEVSGKLLVDYNRKYLRWWRSQVIRYLMRFPSHHMCMLLNKARHEAFGVRAATRVLRSATQIGEHHMVQETDMERWIWINQKPWIPRPLLSVHVRQGDKAKEMTMVDFRGYMALANRLRNRFPQAEDIWLSSEMQDVIDSSTTYPGWNFHYTKVPRQSGNTTMRAYEASLGRQTSSENAFVNFLMAADADFFVGALGSSWCYLIDGMRSTGGKQMAGYLSVNKDRYW